MVREPLVGFAAEQVERVVEQVGKAKPFVLVRGVSE